MFQFFIGNILFPIYRSYCNFFLSELLFLCLKGMLFCFCNVIYQQYGIK